MHSVLTCASNCCNLLPVQNTAEAESAKSVEISELKEKMRLLLSNEEVLKDELEQSRSLCDAKVRVGPNKDPACRPTNIGYLEFVSAGIFSYVRLPRLFNPVIKIRLQIEMK